MSSQELLECLVIMVATLGDLVATTAKQDGDVLLPRSPRSLHLALKNFIDNLYVTLVQVGVTWWRRSVMSECDDSPTSLSQTLAAYESTPWTTWDQVTRVARAWRELLAKILASWARLAREATELRDTCREVAAAEATMAATATAQAGDLQEKATHWRRAHRNLVTAARQLPLALEMEVEASASAAHEARVMAAGSEIVVATMALTEAVVASSRAEVATKRGQRAEAALGLLERLVAACTEATAFPWELQRLLGDIEAALKRTNEASPNVPEDLVAKVDVAEQLWEANAHLAKDYLKAAVRDVIDFYFTAGPASPSACEVDEWCQRAIEDIPRLLQPPESPQSVPKVFPVSMELQELSLALLRPQVTVVATLGDMMAILPNLDKEMLVVSPGCLYWDLEEFAMELQATLYGIGDTCRRHTVTSDDDDPLTSLSQALAAYESTPWTTWDDVTVAASKWQGLVSALVNRWAKLARKATELRNTCRDLATKAADRVALYTARARELQAKAAHYGTVQENMVELGQALGGEEGDEGVARRETQLRRQAWGAASWATRVTMVRQQVEVALGLLERLVAACDEATSFPRELQRRVGDIKDALKGTNEASPDVPEDLEAKVAVAERLWEANAHLAKDHLLVTVDDIINLDFYGDLTSPSAEVAERCQRAIKDIQSLLTSRPYGQAS